MPGLYAPKDYDLAGFSVGAVERTEILPASSIAAGDILLGLASDGLHSNGFSLVRKIVETTGLDWQASSPFDATMSLGESLLTPTRIYVKPVLQAIRTTSAVKGWCILPVAGFRKTCRVFCPTAARHILIWTVAPAARFQLAEQAGGIEDAELLRTFNCGIGMIVVVDAAHVDTVTAQLEDAGETVYKVGQLQQAEHSQVSFARQIGS